MIPVKELLKEILALNKAEKYLEIIDRLPDDLLESYENADLYGEKALASYRLKKYDLCMEIVEKGLLVNPSHPKLNHYRGNIFCDNDLPDRAIYFYEKAIEADPNFELPYHGLGNAYLDLEQNDNAINWYNKALEVNPEFSYSFHGLGKVYENLKQYEKAIEHYSSALKINPRSTDFLVVIAKCYGNLGQAEQALEYYQKAIELDPKSTDILIGIGDFYYEEDLFPEAIDYYSQVLAVDPKNIIAIIGMGACYSELAQEHKAIDFFNNALEIDPNEDVAIYNRAMVYFETRQFQKALTDYESYLTLKKDNFDYYTDFVNSKIQELRKILGNDTFTSITELVDKIKKLLLFTDEFVTHYTSLSVTKNLILDYSPFRLSEGTFLNDTSEGRELYNYLSFHIPTINGHEILSKQFAPKPFIGSFVTESKHDDLTLWRMYGKEAKDEAKGCAITINKGVFFKQLQFKLTPSKMKWNNHLKTDTEFNFYRVAYRKPQTELFIIPGAHEMEEELNGYMREIKSQINAFKQQDDDNPVKAQDILELLNEIAYLFKSAEYQYEHEVRLIIKGIGFEKLILREVSPPKVFIELVPINPALTKITIGPKVEKADEWASAFHYSLERANVGPILLISQLPFK